MKKFINGIKNTFLYHKVLKNDFDWDYSSIFELIKFKLQRMEKYFRESPQLLENQLRYAEQMKVAINILDAGYLSDAVINSDLTTKVNTKNSNRFLSEDVLRFLKKYPMYSLPEIRIAKAKHLFWRYLEHYIELWWI